MTAKEIEKKVAHLLAGARGKEHGKSSGATGLFLGGDEAFDSVSGLNLILAIEEEFKITVDDGDIQPKNFASLTAIVNFIESKLKNP
jgi:acyl carrier protein